MSEDRYILEIDALLRGIPELERELKACSDEQVRILIQRCLKQKEKRLQHLTPFKFRLYLRNICKENGIQDSFLS